MCTHVVNHPSNVGEHANHVRASSFEKEIKSKTTKSSVKNEQARGGGVMYESLEISSSLSISDYLSINVHQSVDELIFISMHVVIFPFFFLSFQGKDGWRYSVYVLLPFSIAMSSIR